MSFSIVLMKNNSDDNVVSKSLVTLDTITGTLRDQCSILFPIIKIQGNVPTNCNYFYIEEFGRYYYMTDIISYRNDLFELHGKVDVLKTYESQIKASTGIVSRQENKFNLYLDDGAFLVYSNTKFEIKNFPSGFSTFEFVLAVAGSEEAVGNQSQELPGDERALIENSTE